MSLIWIPGMVPDVFRMYYIGRTKGMEERMARQEQVIRGPYKDGVTETYTTKKTDLRGKGHIVGLKKIVKEIQTRG